MLVSTELFPHEGILGVVLSTQIPVWGDKKTKDVARVCLSAHSGKLHATHRGSLCDTEAWRWRPLTHSVRLRLQYFQGRLNTTEWINGTVVVRKEYYFNNWMTLLSQLPLLLFTLLNSILYQRFVCRDVDVPLGGCGGGGGSSYWLNDWRVSCFRISEGVRVAGSLVFILLLFMLTAVLVKVPMEEDRFFSVTMATIWFINCKCWRVSARERRRKSGGGAQTCACCSGPVLNWMMPPCSSVRGRAAGQPVRPGGSAAPEVQLHLYERSGPRWDLRSHRHAFGHRK